MGFIEAENLAKSAYDSLPDIIKRTADRDSFILGFGLCLDKYETFTLDEPKTEA